MHCHLSWAPAALFMFHLKCALLVFRSSSEAARGWLTEGIASSSASTVVVTVQACPSVFPIPSYVVVPFCSRPDNVTKYPLKLFVCKLVNLSVMFVLLYVYGGFSRSHLCHKQPGDTRLWIRPDYTRRWLLHLGLASARSPSLSRFFPIVWRSTLIMCCTRTKM